MLAALLELLSSVTEKALGFYPVTVNQPRQVARQCETEKLKRMGYWLSIFFHPCRQDQLGVAHLIEHMVFRGTPKFPANAGGPGGW